MIGIVNIGLGNPVSIMNMCRRLGIRAELTSDREVLSRADRLILPGVGHFRKGIENLRASGLKEFLDDLVLNERRPVLGICLGAQLMTMRSEEGDSEGLKWVDVRTCRFDTARLNGLKVPHMGWTDVLTMDDSPLWMGLGVNPRFYHVHSFHFLTSDPDLVSATAVYGYEFVTAFRKGNIFGTQFHPEKSHKFGMTVLENFSRI